MERCAECKRPLTGCPVGFPWTPKLFRAEGKVWLCSHGCVMAWLLQEALSRIPGMPDVGRRF